MPRFPGGNAELMSYLEKNLRYPSAASEMRVEGTVIVTFVVDKTGLVRSPKVVETSAESPLFNSDVQQAAKAGKADAVDASKNFYDAIEALKEEAIYVVRNMPRWEPASQNGTRVETTYTLPINFALH